jgi:TolB protein
MMIRFLIVAAGALVAGNIPASAERLLQQPILRTYQPVRIALPEFVAAGLSEVELAHAISRIIASDLKQSGAFAPINPAVFAEKNAGIEEVPQFADWRTINAEELVFGRVTRQPDGRIKVEFRLWDAFSGYQLAGQQYTGIPDDSNRIAHMISADIHERITGKKRTFD